MGRIANWLNSRKTDKAEEEAGRLVGNRLAKEIKELTVEYAEFAIEEECLTSRMETIWWETYNALEDEWIATKDTARTPEEHKSVRRISNEKKRERITKERLLLNPVYQDLQCQQRRTKRKAIECRATLDHKARLFSLIVRA